MVMKGQVISQHLQRTVLVDTSFSVGHHPGAWSWHLPFRSLSPMAGANHAPKHSNMVKSKVIAWIHPLQTGLALFVTWGIG